MTDYLRTLESLTTEDAPQVGTKAAALGELHRAGFQVPGGFVLTTSAYPVFIAPVRDSIRARLTGEVIADPAALEGMAEEIRGELRELPFAPQLHEAVEHALAELPDAARGSLIARTSTPSDDLATSFGSGVARAYPGLVGSAEIERAAAKCWAALWNSRSMYYRHRKKIGQTDVALGVLVQPVIRARCAGVMFTEDPMKPGSNEIQITSIWGLGAPLTSARFRPDRFLVDRASGEIRDRSIEEQVVQLVVGEDGHIEEHGLAEELINAPSLTDTEAQELARLGQQIQDLFGAPQDIEWAIEQDTIHVVQARPMLMRTS
jgi:pyruvate,water dikinase